MILDNTQNHIVLGGGHGLTFSDRLSLGREVMLFA